MQFIDLKTPFQKNKKSIMQRIEAVLEHGRYIMGPEIEEVEKKLAKFVGAEYCISVASGTDALLLSLLALDIKAGDEVITTPFSFFSTAETILLIGAKPVFVDIDKLTYNLNPKLLESVINDKTKAIIPVSLYGQCADLTEINIIANKYNVPVIEDGAQSFGAKHHNQMSCNLCTIGTTSFFPSKPLGCYGDGGACFTNDKNLAIKLQALRIHGQTKRYTHSFIGINGRLDTLQAAILLSKLEEFPKEVELREQIGNAYSSRLKSLVKTPFIEEFNTSVYAQYTIEVNNRELFCKYLNDKGIPTAIHYPRVMYKQPALENTLKASCPIAEEKAEKVVSLPMHPYLQTSDVEQIVLIVKEAIDNFHA